ncbi:DotU family type IV/VI secretion system protein [Paraburkholderia gardini]|uniref:DotU family type IV/VI secretion system protein n=1 Tax=Paraburkholderia gardini TaxID=2823469 RepID=UPI001E35F4B1|nr:DotU family type IV/VI secretion system protein [Paraburkholderia gardini]
MLRSRYGQILCRALRRLVFGLRYCLCSALDEAAARTDWGNGSTTGMEWGTSGLATTFGYDRQGGDRVYVIARECVHAPHENRHLIEVIRSCRSRSNRMGGRAPITEKDAPSALSVKIHGLALCSTATLLRALAPAAWPLCLKGTSCSRFSKSS